MKLWIKITVLGLLSVFLLACSTTRYFYIEVMKPAAVTVPGSAKNVLVINNSVPQPGADELSFIVDGQNVADWQMNLDSINWLVTNTLAEVLSNADFFPVVDVYTEEIREDDKFLEIVRIPKDLQTDFFDNLDYDLVISIDRLLFSTGGEIIETKTQFGFDKGTTVYYSNPFIGLLHCSTYIKEKENPLPSFGIKDSLTFEFFLRQDSIFSYWKHPEVIIKTLTAVLAGRAANNYLPNWGTAERMVYSGTSSRMKEAYSYSGNGKWEKALEIWMAELAENPSQKTKAQILSNLAIANELTSTLSVALEYAKESQTIFKEILKDEEDKNRVWIDFYVKHLEGRIMDNQILDIQLGPEEIL